MMQITLEQTLLPQLEAMVVVWSLIAVGPLLVVVFLSARLLIS